MLNNSQYTSRYTVLREARRYLKAESLACYLLARKVLNAVRGACLEFRRSEVI